MHGEIVNAWGGTRREERVEYSAERVEEEGEARQMQSLRQK